MVLASAARPASAKRTAGARRASCLPLIARAIERAAPRLHNAPDPLAHRLAGTTLAWFAFVAVNLPRVLEIAELAVGLDIIAQARPTRRDRLRQRLLDRRHQP